MAAASSRAPGGPRARRRLSGAFILLLEILGGPLAMVVYMLATLFC